MLRIVILICIGVIAESLAIVFEHKKKKSRILNDFTFFGLIMRIAGLVSMFWGINAGIVLIFQWFLRQPFTYFSIFVAANVSLANNYTTIIFIASCVSLVLFSIVLTLFLKTDAFVFDYLFTTYYIHFVVTFIIGDEFPAEWYVLYLLGFVFSWIFTTFLTLQFITIDQKSEFQKELDRTMLYRTTIAPEIEVISEPFGVVSDGVNEEKVGEGALVMNEEQVVVVQSPIADTPMHSDDELLSNALKKILLEVSPIGVVDLNSDYESTNNLVKEDLSDRDVCDTVTESIMMTDLEAISPEFFTPAPENLSGNEAEDELENSGSLIQVIDEEGEGIEDNSDSVVEIFLDSDFL
ncbi:hypothetical protein PCE1_002218 [Barthelona sp. PCE]